MKAASPTYNCVVNAWKQHESELRKFLVRRVADQHVAEDVLQEVFLKAMQQGEIFCCLNSARSWLFKVMHNAVSDHFRTRRQFLDLSEDIPKQDDELAPIDVLAACVPRVLSELSGVDREVLMLCDLQGLKQKEYAEMKGLSLPAAKARVQRARKRFQERLTGACQVQFDEQGQVLSFVSRSQISE